MADINWKAHAIALRAAVKAKDEMLTHYRLGGEPSEALWRRLIAARKAVESFDKQTGP